MRKSNGAFKDLHLTALTIRVFAKLPDGRAGLCIFTLESAGEPRDGRPMSMSIDNADG